MIKTKLLQQTKQLSLITPVSKDGTLTNSTIIDRLGYETAYVNLNWASVTGGPSAATASVKVYSNTASSTSSPTPVLLATLETALDVATAGFKSWAIDLGAANRYVFVEYDSTLTGGTTPANLISATMVLGDKNVEPPVSDTVYGR